MASEKYDEISKIVRNEVEKYYDEPFEDDDHFTNDLHILSDDLSAITLTLEKTLGIRLSKEEYKRVANVRTYTTVIEQHMSGE